MTEETAGAETPAAEDAAENVVEAATDENSDSSTEQQSEVEKKDAASASEETGETSGDDAPAKPDNWVSDRIKELTRKRREAERRAERAEQKLKQAQEANLEDLDWEDQIAERTLRRTRQEQYENERETASELAMQAFTESENIARQKYADYDAVTRNPSLAITSDILEIAMDSDAGPELVYHLGKNPQEAARIAGLPPKRQALELGRIEAKLTAPKPIAAPPPEPVTPIGGSSGAKPQKDPNKMSMAEYAAWRGFNN